MFLLSFFQIPHNGGILAIQVIHGGNANSFDMLAFPTQNPVNANYIQNQLVNFSQSLTDIGRRFIETSQELYERVNDSNVMRTARAAIRVARGMFHPNQIVQLKTIDEVRFAQPIMQRYIMAEPNLRELYHKQQVDGYSDTYADIDRGNIGDQHYDYRRVMTGHVVDFVTEDGEDSWLVNTYSQDSLGDDTELAFEDKISIMNTWEIVEMFVKAGMDPSDPFSGK